VSPKPQKESKLQANLNGTNCKQTGDVLTVYVAHVQYRMVTSCIIKNKTFKEKFSFSKTQRNMDLTAFNKSKQIIAISHMAYCTHGKSIERVVYCKNVYYLERDVCFDE